MNYNSKLKSNINFNTNPNPISISIVITNPNSIIKQFDQFIPNDTNISMYSSHINFNCKIKSKFNINSNSKFKFNYNTNKQIDSKWKCGLYTSSEVDFKVNFKLHYEECCDSLKPLWIDLVLDLMEWFAKAMENGGQGEVVKSSWLQGVSWGVWRVKG